jgi:hypothetical protein
MARLFGVELLRIIGKLFRWEVFRAIAGLSDRKYKKEAPIATSGLSQASNLFLHGLPTSGDTSSYIKKKIPVF